MGSTPVARTSLRSERYSGEGRLPRRSEGGRTIAVLLRRSKLRLGTASMNFFYVYGRSKWVKITVAPGQWMGIWVSSGDLSGVVVISWEG
jgi:hypothetical protein